MKNKKRVISVIIAIAILLVVVGTVLAVTGISNNIKEEKAEVVEEQTESKASEIVLEDNKYMHVETDASGDQVPVPNGFVGSSATGENEIDTGFVIYEGEEEVTDSNVQTAQTSRNQYVWIPVEINSMVMCESNNKLADGEGNKICNLVYDAAKNELKCTNSAHAATATNLVGRLYTSSRTYETDSEGNKIYKEEMEYYKELHSNVTNNISLMISQGRIIKDKTVYPRIMYRFDNMSEEDITTLYGTSQLRIVK